MVKKRRFLKFAVSGALVIAPLALTACGEELGTEVTTNVGQAPPPEETNTDRVDETDPEPAPIPEEPEETNTGRVDEVVPETLEETDSVDMNDPESETAPEPTPPTPMRTNVGRMR